MSKKSFNDIEAVIRNTIEANEPAFKEASWKKMEALLDKDKDRKRPFIFWLWLFIPLLIVTGGVGYFAFNKNGNAEQVSVFNKDNKQEQTLAIEQKDPVNNTVNANITPLSGNSVIPASSNYPDAGGKTKNDLNAESPLTKKASNQPAFNNSKTVTGAAVLYSKNKLADKTKSKMKGSVTTATPETDADLAVTEKTIPLTSQTNEGAIKQEEDVVVVKIETNTKDEKEIEKLIDSVVEKTMNSNKEKTKISRFFFIVAAGAEGSGTKLLSVDKITGRAGLAAGYNLNKNISVQAGFFMSNKKYKADGSSYKTKPGTYWNIVDIKEIEANCKVYEIPVQVNYNFTPGKKLNIFASVGLSSYIMKKEDYSFYYTRYGANHKAEAYYSGNKSLFSVLRIGGGVEKKLGKQFSLFAAPAISIPLAGVGEGEVKLYSTEILIGLKFTPARRNK